MRRAHRALQPPTRRQPMHTLLFKIGTLVFLSSSTVAAILYSGLCPDGKSCSNASKCPTKAQVVAASTMEQTAEPAALSAECAKQKAAYEHCAKKKAAKKAAHGGCPFSKSDTQVAQNT